MRSSPGLLDQGATTCGQLENSVAYRSDVLRRQPVLRCDPMRFQLFFHKLSSEVPSFKLARLLPFLPELSQCFIHPGWRNKGHARWKTIGTNAYWVVPKPTDRQN